MRKQLTGMVEELSADTIDRLLHDHGVGVLSLAHSGETYGFPVSFGYDGDALYFNLATAPESRKLAFIDTTDTATLTVFETDPVQSIIIRGRFEDVSNTDAATAAAALAANAIPYTLDVQLDIKRTDYQMAFYRLTPTTIRGHRFDNPFLPAHKHDPEDTNEYSPTSE